MNKKIALHNAHQPNLIEWVEPDTLGNSISCVRAAKLIKVQVPKPHEIIVKATGSSNRDEAWELQTSLYYYLFGQEWLVPKGFRTDFASIPRPFWFMYPPWREDYGIAAILHDWHRRTKIIPKKTADGIFYECMKQCGTDLFTRVTFYRAVRGFAWMVGG